MPQLDTLTFFSQFFWLSFFFLGFYAVLVKYYLPKISRILKVRSRKISTPQSASPGFSTSTASPVSDAVNVYQIRDTVLTNGIKHSFDLFQEKTKNTSEWLENTVHTTNKIQLKNMNSKYLSTVGDFQAQDIFLFHHLKSVLAPNAFQATGFQKIFNGNSVGLLQLESKEKLYNYHFISNLIKL
jgi:hypothetical protein